ncbi:MAG: lipocalin-like domain-containing protein [Ginsengibacter sp.]
MSTYILPQPSGDLAKKIQGTWWLLSREDRTKDGKKKFDPVLGDDPVGILSYAKIHFAAQFMKRDRTGANEATIKSGNNNTIAADGYDAYFGTYEVDEENGHVAHTLIGSVVSENIGITVSRDVRVNDDNLIIQLETTSADGEPVTRTLIWNRIS